MKYLKKYLFVKSCDDSEGKGGGISIEDLGGIFLVVFIGNNTFFYHKHTVCMQRA